MEINQNLSIDPFVTPYVNDYLGISKASNQTDIQAGQEVNPSNTVEYIPVVYGYRQIVGIRLFTFTDQTGALYAAYALSEGYCRGVDKVYINDQLVDIDYSLLYHRNIVGCTNGVFNSLVTMELIDGRGTAHRNTTSGSGASVLMANAIPTTVLNYTNLCYLVVKFNWPSNGTPSPFGRDVPVVKVNMFGRVMPEFTGAVTDTYSTNPVDVIWDILQHPIYGKNITKTYIDSTSFTAVKNFCNVDITRQGFTYDTFTTNWIMDTGRSTFENLQTVLETYNMTLNYTQGKWILGLEGLTTSNPVTFNESNIIGNIEIHYPSIQEKYNRVYVSYQDKDYNFAVRTQSYPAESDTSLLTADSNIILENRISCNLVTDAFHANDLAQMMLRKSRGQLIYRFTATKIALQCVVGDLAYINTTYPLVANQAVKIISLTLKPDLTVELECALYSTGFYPSTFSNQVKYKTTNPQAISGLVGVVPTVVTSPILPPEPSSQPTYTLRSNKTTFNEGDNVSFLFTATGAPTGTTYNWEFTTYNNIGSLTTADVGGSALTGSFNIDSNKEAYKTFSLTNDVTLEGVENYQFIVRNSTNTLTLASTYIVVNDTSAPSRYGISKPTLSEYLDGQSQNDFAIETAANNNNTQIPCVRQLVLAGFSNANTNYQIVPILLYQIGFILYDLRRPIYRDYEVKYFTWDVVSHGANFYSPIYSSLAQSSFDRNLRYRNYTWNPNTHPSQYRETALNVTAGLTPTYDESIDGVGRGLSIPGGAPTFDRSKRLSIPGYSKTTDTGTNSDGIPFTYIYGSDYINVVLGQSPNRWSEFSYHPSYPFQPGGWYTVRTMIGDVTTYAASVIKLRFWAKKSDGSYVEVGYKNINVGVGANLITKIAYTNSQTYYKSIYGSNFTG